MHESVLYKIAVHHSKLLQFRPVSTFYYSKWSCRCALCLDSFRDINSILTANQLQWVDGLDITIQSVKIKGPAHVPGAYNVQTLRATKFNRSASVLNAEIELETEIDETYSVNRRKNQNAFRINQIYLRNDNIRVSHQYAIF